MRKPYIKPALVRGDRLNNIAAAVSSPPLSKTPVED